MAKRVWSAALTALVLGVLSVAGARAQGSIAALGDKGYHGECNVPGPNTRSVSVVAGAALHRLGLKPHGSILAWAYNVWVKMRNCDLAGIGTNPRLSLDVNPVGKLGVKIDLKMRF